MQALDALDVTGVEPTVHPVPLAVAAARGPRAAVAAARAVRWRRRPESDQGGFAVPKVLEGEG